MASEVHHAKAQDALQQIDLTRQQRERNETMRNELLDSEDFLMQLHSQFYAKKMHGDVATALAETQLRLSEYEKNLSYSNSTTRHNTARYVSECHLEATPEMLVDVDHFAGLRAIDVTVRRLSEVMSDITPIDVLQQILAGTPFGAPASGPASTHGERTSPLSPPTNKPRFGGGGGSEHTSTPGSAEAGALASAVTNTTNSSTGSVLAKMLGLETVLTDEQQHAHSQTILYAFIDASISAMHKAGRLVENARIESDVWLPVLEPVVDALGEMARCRPIGEPLAPLVAEIQALDEINKAREAEQKAAAEDGRVAENEELSRDRLTILEALSDLITHKFRVINAIEDGTLKQLQKETARIREDTTTNATDLMVAAAKKKSTLRGDMSRIQEQMAKAEHDEQLARSAFLEQKSKSDSMLVENAAKQAEGWRQLLEIEAELNRLAAQRRDEVDRRTRMVEREERRRCDMLHFVDFSQGHMALLQRSKEACDAEEELGKIMSEFVLRACNAVDTQVQSMQKTLDDTRRAAHHEHADRFREQFLTLGELLYKKERTADELDKKIELLSMQQDMAMETFDPKAKALSEERGTLELHKDEVMRLVQLLRQKADLYVEGFKPTERALRAWSQAFVHPLEELKQLNRGRSKVADEYYSVLLHAQAKQDIAEQTAKQAHGPGTMQIPPDKVQTEKELEAEQQAIQDARQAAREIKIARQEQKLFARAGVKTSMMMKSQHGVSNVGGGAANNTNAPPRRRPRVIEAVHSASTSQPGAQKSGGAGTPAQSESHADSTAGYTTSDPNALTNNDKSKKTMARAAEISQALKTTSLQLDLRLEPSKSAALSSLVREVERGVNDTNEDVRRNRDKYLVKTPEPADVD